MATKKNIAVVIATIKSIYPYYAKDADIGLLARHWLLLLQEYDDKIINNALLLCLKECETPPTPAHVIRKIEGFKATPYITEQWGELVAQLKEISKLEWYFGSTATDSNGKTIGENARAKARDIYNNLPEELKIYVGSYGEMIRMSRNLDDETLKFAKVNFLKLMPEIRKEHQLRIFGAKTVDMLQENNEI